MALFPYPPVGFHFSVVFQLFPQTPNDFRFQEVSGLDMEMEMETFTEGGQNRFSWQLPKRTRYSDLVLKRGMFMGSGLVLWCQNAFENFVFEPTNITIALLNDLHVPIQAWYIVNAIPKKWSISNFNAEESSVVVESITLSYQFFNVISIESLASGAAAAFL
ncbi:MAG: phage tail protein [Bacteroidota bacterium]|nr:phage tail protein [Bacteroidota bacterium]